MIIPIKIGVLMPVLILLAAIAGCSTQHNLGNSHRKEAESMIKQLNQGEKDYFAEKKDFAMAIKQMPLDLAEETGNYIFAIAPVPYAGARGVYPYGIPKYEGLKAYTGGVFLMKQAGENLLTSIICESEEPIQSKPPAPNFQAGTIVCPPGFVQL